MHKIISLIALLIAAAMIAACGSAANNANSSNKPSNTSNASNATAATTAANPAAIEAEIKKQVSDMAAASQKGDTAYFEKLYTNNYMFVGPDGSTATGKERIDALKSGETKYDSITYDDVSVRSNAEGNGAVSIAVATVKGKNMGRAIDGKFRVMHVWSKAADGWHLASGTATPMTASGPSEKPAANSNAAAANTKSESNK